MATSIAMPPDELSSMRMRGRPDWLHWPLHVRVARPAHWIMQRKQFAELRRRAPAAGGPQR